MGFVFSRNRIPLATPPSWCHRAQERLDSHCVIYKNATKRTVEVRKLKIIDPNKHGVKAVVVQVARARLACQIENNRGCESRESSSQ